MRRPLSTLFALAMATAAHADVPPAPVWVVHQGNDLLGQDLAHLLREKITASPLMRLDQQRSFCRAHVQTMDPNSGHDPGLMTVYSIIVTCGPADVYVASSLGKCGARVLDECAVTLSRTLYSGVMDAVQE